MTTEQPRKAYRDMTKEERDAEFRRLSEIELAKGGIRLVNSHEDRGADPRFDRVVVPKQKKSRNPRGRPSKFNAEHDKLIVSFQSPRDAYDALIERGDFTEEEITTDQVRGRFYYLMRTREHEADER